MIQFLVELLQRIPSTVEVVAEVSHERRRVRRLLEFRFRGAEQLRRGRVEFCAVRALDRPAAANAIRCLYFSGMFVSLSSNFLNSSQPPLRASSSHLKSSKKPGTNPKVPLMSSSVFCFVMMSPPPARCRLRELLTRPLRREA